MEDETISLKSSVGREQLTASQGSCADRLESRWRCLRTDSSRLAVERASIMLANPDQDISGNV